MIALNLLSPEQKSALRARVIYAMVERLMIAFVSTYVVAAAPRVPAPDGGPIPVCPPKRGWNC